MDDAELKEKVSKVKEHFGKNGPVSYDGIIFPPFPGIITDTEKYFQVRRDMECRETDIFLCSFPKSGTHWSHEIISMLISQTTDYNTFETSENFMEILLNLESLTSMTSPRFLITHMPYKYLPLQLQHGKGKIVYVQRNPKDVYVSLYNHQKGKGMVRDDITWPEYAEKHVFGVDRVYGGWFQFTKDWENEFHKDNILPLSYEDLKKDIVGNILKIARFLDVPCSEKFAEEIADRCSFEKLKVNKIDTTAMVDKTGKSLFRKGQVGDWKNWFTVAQNEQFDALYNEEMKNSHLNFSYV